MTLDDLRKDFMLKYPKLDYFTLNEIFKFGDMAYCLGVDAKNDRHRLKNRVVVRSDGKEYKSLIEASIENKVVYQSIRTSITKGTKSAGYNWSYK